MAAIDWKQMNALLDKALTMAPEARKSFIDGQVGDEETAVLLQRLLKASERSTGFLATGEVINLPPKFSIDQHIGPWKINRLLGRGGMGEVYLVDRADGHFSQIAALKLMASHSPKAWDRFQTERQTLATLEHPHIGRLIDGGVTDEDVPYLVMEYVEGDAITVYAKAHNLTTTARLELFKAVCAAVSHANERLVLHRDIKPENILVNADGQVKLIDFGVAGLLAEGLNDGRAPMTLAYAAPEQLAGTALSSRTDVFGLGATLFELLHGVPPPRDPAAFPHLSAPDRDLEAILAQALAHDPKSRYASASALALDIENYLNGFAVAARDPAPYGYAVSKFVQRNMAATIAACVAAAAACLGLIGTTSFALKAQTEAEQAKRALEEANAAWADSERIAGMQLGIVDSFQRMIGGPTPVLSVETVTEQFIADAKGALANPTLGFFEAHKIVALGQFFGKRQDYKSTIAVLEPYISAGGYPDDPWLDQVGEYFLARAYQETGRNVDAVKLYQQALKKFPGSHFEYYPDHVSHITSFAIASQKESDIEQAIETLLRSWDLGKEIGMSPSVEQFYKNQHALLLTYQLRWVEALDVLDLDPDFSAFTLKDGVTDDDTAYLTAAIIAEHAGQAELSEAYLSIAERATRLKGASPTLGRIHLIKADRCLRRDTLVCAETALVETERAIAAFSQAYDTDARKLFGLQQELALRLNRDGQADIIAQIDAYYAEIEPNNNRMARELQFEQALLKARILQRDKSAFENALEVLKEAEVSAQGYLTPNDRAQLQRLRRRPE